MVVIKSVACVARGHFERFFVHFRCLLESIISNFRRPFSMTSFFDGAIENTAACMGFAIECLHSLDSIHIFGWCEFHRKTRALKIEKFASRLFSALLPLSEARCAVFSVYLYDEKLHERPSVHFWLDSVSVGNFLRLLLGYRVRCQVQWIHKSDVKKKTEKIFRRKAARFGIITLRLWQRRLSMMSKQLREFEGQCWESGEDRLHRTESLDAHVLFERGFLRLV